jgi:hypothetical protein
MGDRWNAFGPGGLQNMTNIWLPLLPPSGPAPTNVTAGWALQTTLCNASDPTQQLAWHLDGTVTHEPSAIEPILQAVRSLGFTPEIANSASTGAPPAPEKAKPWWPLALAGVAAVIAFSKPVQEKLSTMVPKFLSESGEMSATGMVVTALVAAIVFYFSRQFIDKQ